MERMAAARLWMEKSPERRTLLIKIGRKECQTSASSIRSLMAGVRCRLSARSSVKSRLDLSPILCSRLSREALASLSTDLKAGRQAPALQKFMQKDLDRIARAELESAAL